MAEAGARRARSGIIFDPLLQGNAFVWCKPIPDKFKKQAHENLKKKLAAMKDEPEEPDEDEPKEPDEDEPKEMPPPTIVAYPDLVTEAWGWDSLLPITGDVAWSDYGNYLKVYYNNNASKHIADSDEATLVAVAKRCFKKEHDLASMLKNLLESNADVIALRICIMFSSLVKEYAESVILKEGVKCYGDSFAAAFACFKCIEEETDLMLELLKRGVHFDDELFEMSTNIRMCALGLMGHSYRPVDHSEIAAGAMLGIADEASMMRNWMRVNQELDVSPLPVNLEMIHNTRDRTLKFMASILTMPYNPAAAVLNPFMEATDTRGKYASLILKDQDQEKIVVAGNSKKRKRIEATNSKNIECARVEITTCLSHQPICLETLDLASMGYAPRLGHDEKMIQPMCPDVHVEKTWGFSRLLPVGCPVEWPDYINYLCEYYKRLSLEFLSEFAANDPEVYPAGGAVNVRAAADFCVRMEKYLLSEWRNWLSSHPQHDLPINVIIESSLIQNCARLSLGTTGDIFSAASAIIFACVALEDDLMCELMRHGAEPSHYIMEQSCVSRMFALSLLNRKRDQSVIAAAAVMMGIAKEGKLICDILKKKKQLFDFCSFTPYELEGSRFIRSRGLEIMTTIVQKSSPSEIEEIS